MASHRRCLGTWCASLLLTGCIHTDPATASTAAVLPERLLVLIEAQPMDWPARIATALPLNDVEAAALAAAVQDRPTAPGAPAAIAVLGRCAAPQVDTVLTQLIDDRGNLATEAALAVGDRNAVAAIASLRDAMNDLAADATLRTAAACGLARMGHGKDVAPFLAAILLAGTPAGVEGSRRFGLPERPRWAMERYLVQRMLLREGAPELARRLDPDASWPDLAQATGQVVAWLAAR
ncbi:MAG: hypothetical protein ACK51X_00915 [Planctomycetota bacterium]